jgi:hypothetical protein
MFKPLPWCLPETEAVRTSIHISTSSLTEMLAGLHTPLNDSLHDPYAERGQVQGNGTKKSKQIAVGGGSSRQKLICAQPPPG